MKITKSERTYFIDGASLCYKFEQLCFITNWGKRYYKLGQLSYYKLGQMLLQFEAAITN